MACRAEGCETKAAPPAQTKSPVEQPLQRFDMGAERGLREVERNLRAAEAACLSQRDKNS